MIKTIGLVPLPARFPLSCQWEITCRCNLRCVMCYTDCFNQPEMIRRELPVVEILRILDEMAEAGCLELCLTGGEPLARPDFFDIYRHVTARGFLVTLFTNGTLITAEVADRLAERPPVRIEISLHSLTESGFERITQGRGSFQRCMQAIDLLLARRLPVTVKTTALTLNRAEILAVKEYIRSLGTVGYKLGETLRPALDGNDAPQRLALSDAELTALHEQDRELQRDACRLESEEPRPCESGMRSFHIDAYGQLHLCSGNRRQGYDLTRGSFQEGFYHHLPDFACPLKTGASLMQPSRSHA